jgi:hypothetical protein
MMNVVLTIIVKLGLAALSALPVERIVALLITKLISKTDPSNIDRVAKTSQHLTELAALFGDMVADKAVSAAEVSSMRDAIVRARARLLAEWSVGADGKSTQVELGKTGLVAEYVDTSSAQQPAQS